VAVRFLSRLLLLAALSALHVPIAWAQTQDPSIPLTAASTDCSTASSCVTLSAPANGVAIALTPVGGTFQAEFEITYSGGRLWSALDMFPPGSTTAAENATAAGQWRGAAGGLVRVRLSSCSSCSVLVTMTPLDTPPTSSSGGSGGGGTTQADDDASIAAGQNMDLMASLGMVFNGTAWVRNTFGAAGTASAQVWTVQGVASMTPVLVNPGTGTNFGVQAEDAIAGNAFNGVAILAVRQDSQSDLAADGDFIPVTVDADGNLRVTTAAGTGTSLADDGDFTAGTTPGTPAMGFYQSSVTACTDGDACTVGITPQRTMKVTLYSAAGSELTPSADQTFGTSTYTEATTTGPLTGAVRNDTLDALANTNNEIAPLAVDALGALWTRALDPCSGIAKTHIPINISTATTTELTSALAGANTNYYICSLNLVTAGANNVALTDDDTDNCASVTSGLAGGTTAASGWNFAANGGIAAGDGTSAVFKTNGANRVVCLVTSAAVQLSGSITVVAAP
jgi:hypothetical protein